MGLDSLSEDRIERFRAIYQENYVPILGYAIRRTSTPEDAADVVADTFLVLWRRLDRTPGGSEMRPWLYGIARNIVSNSQRSERRRASLAARLRAKPFAGDADAAPVSDVVLRAMQQLSPFDREILRLAAWEGLTPAEMATALGCSANAAKVRLHRARKRFARKLELLGARSPVAQSGHDTHDLRFTIGEEDVR